MVEDERKGWRRASRGVEMVKGACYSIHISGLREDRGKLVQ